MRLHDNPRVWVIGPIAWDWVYEVPRLPELGGFVQATRAYGRPGGSGANLAMGLRQLGLETEMVGYVGRDGIGRTLLGELQSGGVGVHHVAEVGCVTSQVLLFLDETRDRSMVGIAPDRLSKVSWPVRQVRRGDLVVLAAWHAEFVDSVGRIAKKAVKIVSVPFEEIGRDLPITHVVGSFTQLPLAAQAQPFAYYADATGGCCQSVILTNAARPVLVHTATGTTSVPVPNVQVVDSTGAGDAFLSGFVAGLASGRPLCDAVAAGIKRGSIAVQRLGSVPPPPDVDADWS